MGLEGPAGGVDISAYLCQGRHREGVRKCVSHAPSSSSPNLTPKSAGLPGGPKELLTGERTKLAKGKPGEAEAQPGPHPTREAPRYQPCPTPTCHLPDPWGPGPPSCWVCSRDAPAAVSQNTESQSCPRIRLGGAEPALALGGAAAVRFGAVWSHFSHPPAALPLTLHSSPRHPPWSC